jgi:hypothetical protein
MRKLYKMRHCAFCKQWKETLSGLCDQCADKWEKETGVYDYYDEPMIYSCSMCGMEIVSFETVRGNKYCHSCAAIERHG